MDFNDKTAIVTGGASGIGHCIVEKFRQAGAQVAVIDRETPEFVCDMFYAGDIAEENTLITFIRKVISKFEKVDFLINNACLSKQGILSGCNYEDFLYVQKVGVAAPYTLTRLLLPYFPQGSAVVNIASTRGFMSQANTESYSAAKGGLIALTHALAISLSGRIRVNAISPGWIDVSDSDWSLPDNVQHPAGRVGRPSDIAAMTLYLCSEAASFITGENIVIDGGMTKLMIYHNEHGWNYSGSPVLDQNCDDTTWLKLEHKWR